MIKKLINKIKFLTFVFIFILSNNIFAANIAYTFTDDEWYMINQEWKIMDKGLDIELNDGPGYELLKEKYNTDNFDIILDNVDKNYGINDGEAKEYTAPSNMRYGSGCNDDMKLSIRDKMILMQEENSNRKEENRQDKDEDEEDKEKGSMKVRISFSMDKNHPDNPTPGEIYSKTYTFYTDCQTLGDVLRENDLTSDSGFLSTFDGINGNVEVDSSYSGVHGYWKGYSFMLYKNGKQTNVGMEDLKITDGCKYRIKAEYQEMTW